MNLLSPIDDKLWQEIKLYCNKRTLQKGEHFLKAGAIATQICFIESGILREYYLDIEGKERIRRFCKAGDASGSLSDLLSGKCATSSIEALTKCQIITIPWAAMNALSEENWALMRLIKKFTEELYLRKSMREFEMLSLSALERYQRFELAEPDLITKIPRFMIASYLGISQVHLSRICAPRKPKQLPKVKT